MSAYDSALSAALQVTEISMLLTIAEQTRMSGIVWVDERLLDVLFKNFKLFPPYSGVHTKIPGRPLREWLVNFHYTVVEALT